MGKKKFDLHTHSHFSLDSETPLEDMIEAAIEVGITDYAITDHVDYDYDSEAELTNWEVDEAEYDKAITRFQEKYKDKIRIYKGIEFGVQPHLAARMDEFVNRNNFDFVIASQHTVDSTDLYETRYFDAYSDLEAVRHYYEMYHTCAKMSDAYSVLGHLDLYIRYKKTLADIDMVKYIDYIDSIFDVVIAKGKGIEINAGGFKYKLGDNNPSQEILKRYREKGGEIITLGSDAHTPNYIGLMHDENIEMLKALNFKYVCTFEKMKPIFHALKDL